MGVPPRTSKSHSIMEPAKTFEKFGQLPFELRLKIWKFALPPCIVDVVSRSRRRLVTRVSSDCAIGDHTPGSWDAFFNGESGHRLFVDRNSELFDEYGPTRLHGFKFSCTPLNGILNACYQSRLVVAEMGYARAFATPAQRATTLFSAKDDTLYIRCGQYANLVWLGADVDFEQGSSRMDSVEKLAIGVTWYGWKERHSYLRSADNMVMWVRAVCDNVKQITFVMQYGTSVDYSELVSMDIEDFRAGELANVPLLDGPLPEGEPHKHDNAIEDEATLAYKKEKKKLTQWLLVKDEPNLVNSASVEAFDKLTFDRKIFTIPEIKATFRDARTWHKARKSRLHLNLIHAKSRARSSTNTDENMTVGDLISVWVADFTSTFNFTGEEKIKINRKGRTLKNETRVLDLKNLEEGESLRIKVWDGKHWR